MPIGSPGPRLSLAVTVSPYPRSHHPMQIGLWEHDVCKGRIAHQGRHISSGTLPPTRSVAFGHLQLVTNVGLSLKGPLASKPLEGKLPSW